MLPKDFYIRENVVKIAQDLLGKVLITDINGVETAGIITETEAYAGIYDKASHAYGGRRTPRTEIMYKEGGTAYVYLCYGMHSLFNVVTNKKDVPDAVLIRGIHPLRGIEIMKCRRNKTKTGKGFTDGPAKASQALGITVKLTGKTLFTSKIHISDEGFSVPLQKIKVSKRIGIDYAEEDALLPYRFFVQNIDWKNYGKIF